MAEEREHRHIVWVQMVQPIRFETGKYGEACSVIPPHMKSKNHETTKEHQEAIKNVFIVIAESQ